MTLIAGLAFAQDPDVAKSDPFRGRTRICKGPQKRITIRVPVTWKEGEAAGSIFLRVIAPGQYGAHDLTLRREEGQDDVDKQRDRYLEFDSANSPKATIKEFSSNVPSTRRMISLSTNAPKAIAAIRVTKNASQKPKPLSKAVQAIKVVNMAIWP